MDIKAGMAELVMSGKLIVVTGLLLGSLIDIRCMKVPMPLVTFMAACGWGIRAINGVFWQTMTLWNLIPGLFLMICAWVTHEKIGFGDAWIVLALGTLMDFQNTVGVIMWAFWGAGLIALLFFVGSRKKDLEIPFVPFLFLGYAIYSVLG